MGLQKVEGFNTLKPPKILILDGMWNKTLAIVRSLGRKGFNLTVGEKTRFATALFSRYCNRRVVYPSPLSMPDEFLDWLLTEIKKNNYEMIIPTELATQILILKNRIEVEKYTRLPFADYDLVSNHGYNFPFSPLGVVFTIENYTPIKACLCR